MTTVGQILADGQRAPISVDASSSVYDAIQLMSQHNIGAVTVLQNGRLVGILTERDYARKVILLGKSSPNTPVSDIMHPNPICVFRDHTVEECMALMTDKTIRHLPVLENNELVGIISIGDLVKATIQEKDFLIEQLGHYVQGAG